MDQTDCSSTFSSNLITQETGKERNWAELPFDILSLIYQKLGSVEVLESAQAVCRPWRRLSYEPSLWRYIHLRFHFKHISNAGILCEAVNRSGGNVEELYIENMDNSRRFCLSRTLLDIDVCTDNLRCLVLISSPFTPEIELVAFIQCCPLLEEVEINNCFFETDTYGSIGRSCRKLKRFRLNTSEECGYSCRDAFNPNNNKEALEIADNMLNLRELQLVGNKMSSKGLHAILDKCIHLETLVIRECFNLRFTKRIRDKLSKINTVLPSEEEWGTEGESEDESISIPYYVDDYISNDSDDSDYYDDYDNDVT